MQIAWIHRRKNIIAYSALRLALPVWEKSKILYSADVSDLQSNTTAFNSLRQRLFLIGDETLRVQIVAFYKKLKDTAKKTKDKVETLATTADAIAEQTGFEAEFKAIGEEAKQIIKDLKS